MWGAEFEQRSERREQLATVLGSNGVSRPKGDWLCYCKAMKRSGMATGMAT